MKHVGKNQSEMKNSESGKETELRGRKLEKMQRQ